MCYNITVNKTHRRTVMIHIHKKTGIEFDVGFCNDFDMSIITKWPTNPGDDPIELIDYYFGEYDPETTDRFIDDYFEKMENLKNGLKFLEGEYLINCVDGNFMEPEQKTKLENSIETLKVIVNN
jgi:hypothetical protein